MKTYYNHRIFFMLFCLSLGGGTLITLNACAESESPSLASEEKISQSWKQAQAFRERQHASYLRSRTVRPLSTDAPSRVPWYSNRLGYAWFTESALGWNGVPYILLRAVIELYPEIWAGEGSLGDLGFGPHPDDYDPVTGKLLPVEQRRPLPYGLVTTQDPTVPEERRTDNVFFTCSACHSGRVYVNGRVRRYIGAPNTEIEAQGYTELLYRTGKALLKSEEADLSRDQINPAEIARIADFLESKIATDPAWFYGGRTEEEREAGIERAKVQVIRLLNHLDGAIGALIETAAKAELLYLKLAYNLAYASEKDGPQAPGIFRPGPGRMDAFGIVAGLVALHAHRESFLVRLPEDHPFFEGLAHLSGRAKYQAAGWRLFETAPQWMPQDPGPSDIMALWYSRDHIYANWDANQAVEARVIASGVSSVGDPSKVDVEIHEAMNPFIDNLPPPPYPFTVNMELAAQGKPLFEQKCATACHHAKNPKVYDVGTEMNRAWQISPTARLGLLELTREACELYVEQGGSDWCRPKRGSREEDDEAYFVTPRGDRAGYKANVLHGIWAQAPYLHNGSVPTLWHLLRPAERPATFIRGNINYDEALVGFVWDEAPALDEYGDGDAVHYAEHETHLRGNSNQGHTFGSQWSDDQVRAVIEYMKTL